MIFRAVSFMEAEPPPQGAWGLRGWDGVGLGWAVGLWKRCWFLVRCISFNSFLVSNSEHLVCLSNTVEHQWNPLTRLTLGLPQTP